MKMPNWFFPGLLLMAILLPVSQCRADNTQHFYLFGDSLSAVPNSWAELLNKYDYAHIHNISRGGLRLIDITIPEWLYCSKYTQVIIRLGTNDAGNMVTDQDYEVKLRQHLDTLQSKEGQVWLALPLHLTELGSAIEERTLAKRALTERVSREYQNVTLLDVPYDPNETTDGLHPTAWQQVWTALWFITALELI